MWRYSSCNCHPAAAAHCRPDMRRKHAMKPELPVFQTGKEDGMDESKTRAQRIAAKVRKKQRAIRVANGLERADLVLKNASYVNVFTDEICTGDIAVSDGLIAGVGEYHGIRECDMRGKIVAPGFIDAHIHLESSMVSPMYFAKAVVQHGTTAVVTDPHEIANVCGTAGIDYMMSASAGLPIDVMFMLPSCVPSVAFEENGQTLSWRDINAYFDHPRVLGLAEMMNYPGVAQGDRLPIEKIVVSQAHHKKIDGHAPGLSGASLNAYMSAGIYSDHECDTAENALEKLRKGLYVMIREGTAAQNLEALMPLTDARYASRCMFATDDKHPEDLLHKGHMDFICRKAVRLGADPIIAVKLASYNVARYFLMNNRGAIAPGYLADFAVLDNLTDFNVLMTFKRGVCVYDGRNVQISEPEIDPDIAAGVLHSFNMPELAPEDFHHSGTLPLIGLVPGSIVTEDLGEAAAADASGDIAKLAVIERHHGTGHLALSYLKGYGIREGAVATSIAHDSHNLIVCGASDADMALAANSVREMNGGIAVVRNGAVIARLRLEIAGLFSAIELEHVNAALSSCKECAHALGVSGSVDPFMNLSFLSLPVIPSLRLTTLGVYDVCAGSFRTRCRIPTGQQ